MYEWNIYYICWCTRFDRDLTMKMWWQLKMAWESFQHLLSDGFCVHMLKSMPTETFSWIFILSFFFFFFSHRRGSVVSPQSERMKKNKGDFVVFLFVRFTFPFTDLSALSNEIERMWFCWWTTRITYWIGKFGRQRGSGDSNRQRRTMSPKKNVASREADKLFSSLFFQIV